MDDAGINSAVDAAYKKKYPEITNTKVRHIVREMLPGALVVVVCSGRGQNGLAKEWEEMCYVRDDRVQIFDDTEALVRAMLDESRNLESIQDLQERRAALQHQSSKVQSVKLSTLIGGSACVALACFFGIYYSIRLIPALLGVYGLALLILALGARGTMRRLEVGEEEIDYKIDLQRYRVSVPEARAEKILRLNDFQLRRYYESTLRQNAFVFWLGIFCIILGVAISAFALYLVAGPAAVTVAGEAGLGEKIVTAVLGAVSALLTNYVATIYLKMHAEAAKNLVTLHSRLVDTHRSLFGNLVASRITDEKLRWDTLAKIALTVSKFSDATTAEAAITKAS
jgi:Flp pilus assembly protein TadB